MELCRGGGCGCKVSPAALRRLLGGREAGSRANGNGRLLVGNSTSDDCAAWQVSDETVMVGTADFFMPVVDDPRDFGRIAATNALSDVYAMGADPCFALALAAVPLGKVSEETAAGILAGGEEACAAVGVPVAGGHTIDSSEPIYGLSVSGTCSPAELCRNDTARAGDALLLGKPLGIGILSAALRKGKLDEGGMDALVGNATRPNRVGRKLATAGLPSAMTDVTGFGVLGHVLEMCRGSGVSARIRWDDLPLIEAAVALARQGTATGASSRNWESYGHEASVEGSEPWQRDMLTDPQTSGGLLVACPDDRAEEALGMFRQDGHEDARAIGEIVETPGDAPVVEVVF